MLDLRSLPARQLGTLVENRTTFTLEAAALNLFETHERAMAVPLRFDQPVLASMVQGRKVMHLRQNAGFNFLPGESVMLPDGELMTIDFPDADEDSPTKCLALEIDPDEIRKVVEGMNEERPRWGQQDWGRGTDNFHFANDPGISQLLQRLIYLCAEDHPSKDLFVRMSLRELIIRVMEAESRHGHVLDQENRATSQPVTAVVAYILGHLDEKLTVRQLSKLACMSESGFYRTFRNEIGYSPVDFINQERIKLAKSLLRSGADSVQTVAMRCGFNSPSYFTRTFKKHVGVNPQDFQVGREARR